MALQLSHELGSGITGNYWRVKNIAFDLDTSELHCKIALYKDSAARTAGKAPISETVYHWSGGDFTGWFDATTLDTVNYNPQERAYVKLKTLAEFSGATDV